MGASDILLKSITGAHLDNTLINIIQALFSVLHNSKTLAFLKN